MAKKHWHCVQTVVFGSKNKGFANTVPVERRTKHRFCKIAIRIVICPLALSLETACNRIAAMCFFTKTGFFQFWVTNHQVAENQSHFHHNLPLPIFTFAAALFIRTVKIGPFLAVFLCPGQCFFIFCLVVNSFVDTAFYFGHVHKFGAHSQVILKKIWIHHRTGNPHGSVTQRKVRFAFHLSHCQRSLYKTENFFLHISRNVLVAGILHIAAINSESRQTFLSVSGQRCCQINRSRTFGSVKTPNGFWHQRMRVHYFGSVAPRRGNC